MYSAAAILSAFVSSSCSARSQAERELQQEVREPIEKRRPLGYATKLARPRPVVHPGDDGLRRAAGRGIPGTSAPDAIGTTRRCAGRKRRDLATAELLRTADNLRPL